MISRFLPVIVWAGVIFYLSSLPVIHDPSFNLADFIFKKSAHVFEYAVLFGLTTRALSPRKDRFRMAFLFGLLYAFLDETHQLFTPGRGGTLRDVLVFDTLGLSLSWFLLRKRL